MSDQKTEEETGVKRDREEDVGETAKEEAEKGHDSKTEEMAEQDINNDSSEKIENSAEAKEQEEAPKDEKGLEEQEPSNHEKAQGAPPTKKQRRNTDSKEDGGSGDGASGVGRRRSIRSKGKGSGDAPGPKQIIEFLLSDEALELLGDKMDQTEKNFRFPRDRLNPFQDLLAACMVSKPFSHVLGTRAINGLFSEAHGGLATPKAVLDFGRDKIYESLSESRTQHRDKTSDQLMGIAQTCADEFGDNDSSLDKLRDRANKDPNEEADLLIKMFKGYGRKTADIYFRRVQVEWEEIFPFADDASMDALKQVGLNIKDEDELVDLIKYTTGVKEGKELREKFGRIVDVAVYLGLEGKTNEVASAAQSLP